MAVADYVLLHRDTGTAHYATRATDLEIQQANQRLQMAGSACRYVAARHMGAHWQPHQKTGVCLISRRELAS
jgi:hypothetical protein